MIRSIVTRNQVLPGLVSVISPSLSSGTQWQVYIYLEMCLRLRPWPANVIVALQSRAASTGYLYIDEGPARPSAVAPPCGD